MVKSYLADVNPFRVLVMLTQVSIPRQHFQGEGETNPSSWVMKYTHSFSIHKTLLNLRHFITFASLKRNLLLTIFYLFLIKP